MDINAFKQQIEAAGGFARPNRFGVSIWVQSIINNIKDKLGWSWFETLGVGDGSQDTQRLDFFCSKAEIPGVTFSTYDQRIYGPEFKVPVVVDYQQATLQFYVGADMMEKYFFDAWHFSIVDPRTNDFNYIGEFSTTIDVTQYDEFDTPIYKSRLIDAWPVDINQLNVAYGDTNTIHELAVVFTFKKALPVQIGQGSSVNQPINKRERFKDTITTRNAVGSQGSEQPLDGFRTPPTQRP